MRHKVYIVALADDERQRLQAVICGGTAKARMVNRAQILLHAHEGKQDKEVAAALHTSESTVGRIRKRFVEQGLHAALHEVDRPGGVRTLGGEQEAHLVALACSDPPKGRREWTMQLLADRLVTLGIVETISDETVRRTLKKGASNRGSTSSGDPDRERGVCLLQGRCPTSLRRTARSDPSGRLFR